MELLSGIERGSPSRNSRARALACWAITTVLTLSGAAQAAGVVVGNQEWRQLTETAGLTWNQVATVCSSTTGACSGTVAGVNVDGWTWATVQEVGVLFETLIDPTTINFPSFSTTFFEANSADIAGAFDNYGFSPTRVNASERAFLGWTRSFPASNPTAAYAPAFRDFFSSPPADEAILVNGFAKATSRADVGVFLFTGATVVPIPPAVWLFGSALGLVGVMRRKISS